MTPVQSDQNLTRSDGVLWRWVESEDADSIVHIECSVNCELTIHPVAMLPLLQDEDGPRQLPDIGGARCVYTLQA